MKSKESIQDLAVYPILILEDYFPHELRHKFFRILMPAMSFLFVIYLLLSSIGFYIAAEKNPILPLINAVKPRILGLFLLFFAMWLLVYLLESFFRAIFFHNRAFKIRKKTDEYEMTSEVATVFYHTERGDIITAFFNSLIGSDIMARCGIMQSEMKEFLTVRENVLQLDLDDMRKAQISDIRDFALFIFHNYKDFSDFLFKHNISEKDFAGAAEWACRVDENIEFRERWWSRDNLKKIGSLGRDFSFGHTFMLDKYAQEVTIGGAAPATRDLQWENEVKAVEAALSKSSDANVMVIGDDGVGTMDMVYELAYEIDTRSAPPVLQDKRLLLVDSNLLMATSKEKATLEQNLIKLANEAIKAGNIILVFKHFTSFVTGAQSIGTDVIDMLNPYFQSPALHFIALAPTEEYHRVLSPNGEMITKFALVQVKQPEDMKTISLLEDGALMLERKYHLVFTYPAIVEVFHSAENYITDGVMPNKATDLLLEIAPYLEQKGDVLIGKNEILDFMSFKTKIPLGKIGGEEQTKLQNLESELHKRIVGQNDAVVAISDAMRRSRAGVRDPKKPIGTFLFLGPTGVGKTETAKALASVYFGAEDKMSRLDMSEYQGTDALERLIGSFELGKPGTLSMLVKNTSYGVLLLDEFEKTSPEVQNLFLQVLDEGFFSDMGGHKVTMRNLIIIATSNAGSSMMYEAIEHAEDLHAMKSLIIDEIIKKGTLKPELLNRFDGVILFNPLEKKDVTEIAKIMAEGLRKRLHDEHSIDLTVNDALIQALVKEGQDPLFGGRPMARAVKDKIEKLVAQKIISGVVQPGGTVELTAEELK